MRKGRCNQFALGGRGDPDQHEHFEEILQICRENNLVPNFTMSEYGMTTESLDNWEGGRYSCCIGADMIMVPCSFDQEKRYEVSLKDMSIEEAWNSELFERFREGNCGSFQRETKKIIKIRSYKLRKE